MEYIREADILTYVLNTERQYVYLYLVIRLQNLGHFLIK